MAQHDSLSQDVAIGELIDSMSVREKAAQLAGSWVGTLEETRTVADAERMVVDHGLGFLTPFGFGASPIRDPVEAAEVANRLQRAALEESPSGIPIAIPVDAIHGHAYVQETTVFPHNVGLAATGDRDLVERVGAITAREVAATGARVTYGPTCDVARDARWGRVFETFGESPHLAGELAAAKATGVRTADVDVAAMAKHFPAYGEPVRGEDASPVDRSLSSIRRDFVRSFEPVLDAGVDAVMPSYNSINGEPSHASSYWLGDVLREELDFEGYVASDWNAIRMLTEDHAVADSMEAAVGTAIDAGVDVHSVGETDHAEHVASLVEAGVIDESAIDDSVRRILELKRDLGLFEDPFVDVERTKDVLNRPAHREVAREAARKSMTLLENNGGTLPFDPAVGEVLVTGPNADALSHQAGGWSLKTDEQHTGTTVREGIERVVDGTTVTYEQGAAVDEPVDVEAAGRAAADADAAVVVLGENWYLHEFGPQDVNGPSGAFPNREQLSLPAAQRDLLERVLETGTPTALVTTAGRPLAIPWAAEHADAILHAYYPGAEGGLAIAETLFGETNPGGVLPISVPRSIGQVPVRHNYLKHPHPIGEDEHLPTDDPLWAFGHGLSYTDVAYRDLSLSTETLGPDGTVTATVELENTGERAGDEVLQLFGSRATASQVTPVRELVAFDRVSLAAGETKTVSLPVPADAFAVFQPDGSRRFESGSATVTCGPLTTELRLQD